MMDDVTFTVQYDDQPNEVVDKIADVLLKFGLTIEIIDEGDGFVQYQIIQDAGVVND